MVINTREKIEEATDRIFNQGDIDFIDEIYAEDMVMHHVPGDRTYEGREAFKQWRREHSQAFPDFTVEHDDIIIGEEKFVTQWTATATHEGPLPGLNAEPTHKPIRYKGVTIHKMGEETLIEAWWYFDQFGILGQLGLLPGSPEAGQ
jgi:steroid delta-isomerase-like uncharacterized protein